MTLISSQTHINLITMIFRANSVCGPNGWQKVLAKGINLVKSVPKLITEKIPKAVFKDGPQKIVDVRNSSYLPPYFDKQDLDHCQLWLIFR